MHESFFIRSLQSVLNSLPYKFEQMKTVTRRLSHVWLQVPSMGKLDRSSIW